MGPKAKLSEIVQILILLLTETKNSKLKNESQKWPLKVKKHFLTVKKVIHFLTNKERPDFKKKWTLQAWNCPKINFAFDQKILNSKTKLKNDPLKNRFLTVPY